MGINKVPEQAAADYSGIKPLTLYCTVQVRYWSNKYEQLWCQSS